MDCSLGLLGDSMKGVSAMPMCMALTRSCRDGDHLAFGAPAMRLIRKEQRFLGLWPFFAGDLLVQRLPRNAQDSGLSSFH